MGLNSSRKSRLDGAVSYWQTYKFNKRNKAKNRVNAIKSSMSNRKTRIAARKAANAARKAEIATLIASIKLTNTTAADAEIKIVTIRNKLDEMKTAHKEVEKDHMEAEAEKVEASQQVEDSDDDVIAVSEKDDIDVDINTLTTDADVIKNDLHEVEDILVEATQEIATKKVIEQASTTSSEIAALIDTAPDALNTLNELAAALGDDENFSTNIWNAINDKAASDHEHDASSAVYFGSTTPTTDGTYTHWWDDSFGEYFILYEGVWVQAAGRGAANAIDIESDQFVTKQTLKIMNSSGAVLKTIYSPGA